MPEPAIEVKALTKTFERKPERGWKRFLPNAPTETLTAVDHVDLTVPRGELFGLLGPNGAGKTTLVKLLATLLIPTDGEARVTGLDVVKHADAVRRKVGVVLGGERALYWRLTARENLWYFSQLYDMPQALAAERITQLLDRVGLADRADDRVENYSKGMKQRLHIARGLLNDPEVLLLDEPTIGLDPHAARSLRKLVRDVVDDRGTTVVLTTHYMQEADALSDRVAIMDHGRIVACDTPRALKARYANADAYEVTVRGLDDADALRDAFAAVAGVREVAPLPPDAVADTDGFRVLADGATNPALGDDLARAVADHKARLVALRHDEPTLEDAFISLTGQTLTEKGGKEAPGHG